MGQFIANNALALADNDKELAILLTNIGMNIVSSGAGAAVGGAIGGSSGALNGAGIASILQEYNAGWDKLAAKLVGVALKGVQKAAQLSGSKTAIAWTNKYGSLDDIVYGIEYGPIGQMMQNAGDAVGDAVGHAEFSAADKINLTFWGMLAYITITSEAGKPTNTGHPPADLSGIPNNTGTPIPDQDKNAGSIIDPIPDANQGWNEGFTILEQIKLQPFQKPYKS